MGIGKQPRKGALHHAKEGGMETPTEWWTDKMDVLVVVPQETPAAPNLQWRAQAPAPTSTATSKPRLSDGGTGTTTIPAPVVPTPGNLPVPTCWTTTESRRTIGPRIPLTVRGGHTFM
eukprot:scaffold108912_cov35-Attheya_sp.AAC.8